MLLYTERSKKSQKKQVILISTASKATTCEVERRVRPRQQQVVWKPDVILKYS